MIWSRTPRQDIRKIELSFWLIALAGMSVYLLPYFRSYYYDAYLAYFGINDMQMGMLGSAYGALAIVGYCLGGWGGRPGSAEDCCPWISDRNRSSWINSSFKTAISCTCSCLRNMGNHDNTDLLEFPL